MAYYLIDYENVKMRGLDGLSQLKGEDKVCIFYSENADSLTFEMHRTLNEAHAEITYQKVEVGTKNALDFQLATYLGYIICENIGKGEEIYYIVTKDNGFSSLVNYWTKQKIKVKIAMDCTGKNDKEAKNELLVEVEKLVDDKTIAPIVVKFIQQYKTKQGVSNALCKEFKDSKRASEVYKEIKPLLADKKGN